MVQRSMLETTRGEHLPPTEVDRSQTRQSQDADPTARHAKKNRADGNEHRRPKYLKMKKRLLKVQYRLL